MREEQRTAVQYCASGSRFQILQGAAGTGKSASLTALRLAYESSGNRVIGLAPSGAAAAELENSAGIKTRTIHSLLMRLENDNEKFRETLRPTDVIVCDEAGLADLRTLHKLAGYCDAAGAKLILVGDGRELEAVGSASSLDMLTQKVGCSELIEIARQKAPADRAISQAWFQGPAEQGGLDALSLYQLDTPEQRARTLYVSSGGNPADDTARALRGLADRTGVRQVDLVYDRDDAGTRHIEALTRLLAEQAPDLQVADRRDDYKMAEGEDPNDLLQLDLNANDLEALCSLVDHPKAVAAAATPHDPREQARIIDVLAEIKSQITITNYEVRE